MTQRRVRRGGVRRSRAQLGRRWLKLILLLALGSAVLAGGASATLQEAEWGEFPIPIEGLYPKDIAVADENNIWVTGFDLGRAQPVILHTADGGETWEEQESGINDGWFNAIYFNDPLTGIVVGRDNSTNRVAAVKTTDGGETWNTMAIPPINGILYDVTCTGGGTCWSVGRNLDTDESLILYSNDGTTWNVREHPAEIASLYGIDFPAQDIGYAAGRLGTGPESAGPFMLKTEDGGDTWRELNLPGVEGGSISALDFWDPMNGVVVGHIAEDGLLGWTGDGGVNWEMTRLHKEGYSLGVMTVDCLVPSEATPSCFAGGVAFNGNPYAAIWGSWGGGGTWDTVFTLPGEQKFSALDVYDSFIYTTLFKEPNSSLLVIDISSLAGITMP